MSEIEAVPVKRYLIYLCDLCIAGKGEECHTPGCALWMHSSPGNPIGTEPYGLCAPYDAKALATRLAAAEKEIERLKAIPCPAMELEAEATRLRDCLKQCVEHMQVLLVNTQYCGDFEHECPLHDAHKSYSTAGVIEQAQAALAQPKETQDVE